MTHPASRLEKLNEAIAHMDTLPNELSGTDREAAHEILNAARSYAALMPLLLKLTEARAKSSDGDWVFTPYEDSKGNRGKMIIDHGGSGQYVAEIAFANNKNPQTMESWANKRTENAKFIALAANITGKIGEILDRD